MKHTTLFLIALAIASCLSAQQTNHPYRIEIELNNFNVNGTGVVSYLR